QPAPPGGAAQSRTVRNGLGRSLRGLTSAVCEDIVIDVAANTMRAIRVTWNMLPPSNRHQIRCSLNQVLRPAQVAPIVFIGAKSENLLTARGKIQIGVDDRENPFLRHHRKQTRREDLDAGKRQRLQLLRKTNKFRLLIRAGSPAAKLIVLIEEQVSGSLPFFHRQRGECLILRMKFHHAPEINRAENIDVVQNEGLIQTVRIVEKEPRCFPETAAGIQQNLLARDFNSHSEIILRFQIIGNHVGKMVHIHNDFAYSRIAQPPERDLQKRTAGNLHQRLGPAVCQWPQTRAKTGGQNHGFHLASLSNPRWPTTTSTPFLPRKCLANCSARYTERCCPPVQPNETIRFLNPRL